MGNFVSYPEYPTEDFQTAYYAALRNTEAQEGHTRELISRCNVENPDGFVSKTQDNLETLNEFIRHQVEIDPENPMLGRRDETQEGRPYVWKTRKEVFETSLNLAKGYDALGLINKVEIDGQTWQFMGIMSKNRTEWLESQFACMFSNTTITGFYDTLGPSGCEFIIDQTQGESISVSGNFVSLFIKMKQDGKAETLKNLISFDEVSEYERNQAKAAGLTIYTNTEVIEAGKAHDVELEQPGYNSVYMFSYTSGTTGNPKAVMMTHKMAIAVASSIEVSLGLTCDKDDIHLSFLPYAHSLEQCMTFNFVMRGSRIGYFGGDVQKLIEDCQALKPTLFLAVPRLLNKIYGKITAGVQAKGGIAEKLFNRAMDSKLYNLHHYAIQTHPVYDRVVFAKFKNMMGGNLRAMITGSAPINPDVLDFLKCCFQVPIYEGYGQTEVCCAAIITRVEDGTSGHVGGPIGCIKVRLRDVPEMSYLSSDKPYPRGEIQMKGPSVFKGYFRDPEKTAEAFDEEGWLNSGDVGELRDNGSIRIIDRAKNIFKLSQGEYIAPEKLENIYVQHSHVAQVFVHGSSLENHIVGIIVLDPEVLTQWCETKGLKEEDIKSNPNACKTLTDEVASGFSHLHKVNNLNSLEKLSKFHLITDPFTIENGLLTSTIKLKRHQARIAFKDQLATMYLKSYGK